MVADGVYANVWWVFFTDDNRVVLWDLHDPDSMSTLKMWIGLLCWLEPEDPACTSMDHLYFKNFLFSFAPKGEWYLRQGMIVLQMWKDDPYCDPDETAAVSSVSLSQSERARACNAFCAESLAILRPLLPGTAAPAGLR